MGIVFVVCVAASVIIARFVIARAEPILRARVVQTLSARFHSRIALEGFGVAIGHGIEVTGNGLQVFGPVDPNPHEPGMQSLISVHTFRFGTSMRSLFRSPMHIDTVYVDGLVLNVPPKGSRQEMTRLSGKSSKISIVVDKFVCENTQLLINTSNPQKPPLEFAISNLTLKDVGADRPFQFDATLVNPKPVGDIHSTGLFGPLRQDEPRETAVQGQYSFTDADLATIRGIGGTLSSTGEYSGTLGNIEVRGSTDTPDFQIASSGHPIPLHTDFHAIVDGTSGDTYLRPVKAKFLHSSLTASGSVVRTMPRGHDIQLDVVLEHARIEDILRLGVRTEPAIMDGPLEMKTRLNLPPGQATVADRLKLNGTFHVPASHFTNEKVQGKLDSLSLISQGKPKEAREHMAENVSTDLQGTFTLDDGVLSFSLLHFLIPGTHIDMAGVYSLDGQTFDFHGTAKLQATVSHMTTGWKSVLLKPVDPFFRKDGAGTEIPIKVTGTQSEPHFGLDFGGRDKDKDKDKGNSELLKRNDLVSQKH